MMPRDDRGAPASTAALERLRMMVPDAQPPTAAPPSDMTPEVDRNSDERSLTTLIQQVMDATGSAYIVEHGDIYGRWEQGLFHFTDLGSAEHDPVLQVHGTWERYLGEEAFARAATFCNEWNAENVWPKAYAQLDEEHRIVGIFGETTVDLSAVLTLELVRSVVHQGIETALGLFVAAAEAFPDARPIQ